MLASSLRRDVCDCSLDDLEECLLNAFTAYIPCYGCILGFTCDLVDLIHIYDTLLSSLKILIGSLIQPQKYILYIFAHISGLSQ